MDPPSSPVRRAQQQESIASPLITPRTRKSRAMKQSEALYDYNNAEVLSSPPRAALQFENAEVERAERRVRGESPFPMSRNRGGKLMISTTEHTRTPAPSAFFSRAEVVQPPPDDATWLVSIQLRELRRACSVAPKHCLHPRPSHFIIAIMQETNVDFNGWLLPPLPELPAVSGNGHGAILRVGETTLGGEGEEHGGGECTSVSVMCGIASVLCRGAHTAGQNLLSSGKLSKGPRPLKKESVEA